MQKSNRIGRNRGKVAERYVCAWLETWTGFRFNRTPSSGALRWHKDNRVAGDVVTKQEQHFPFTVEVKMRNDLSLNVNSAGEIREKSTLASFWKQCVKDAERTGKYPMVFCRQLRMPASKFIVLLSLESVDIMHEYHVSTFPQYLGVHSLGFCAWNSDYLLSLPFTSFREAYEYYTKAFDRSTHSNG